MRWKLIVSTVATLLISGGAMAADFSIQFNWDGLKLCTSGSPNRVGSPAFTLKGVPPGTTVIEFKLKDVDVPQYDHGGGKLKITGDGVVPAGAFKYQSPCPPNGKHTYRWTATAKNAKGKKVGVAAAERKYPE